MDIFDQSRALDIAEMDSEFYQRRRLAVRQRFLVGLLDTLHALPHLPAVHVDFTVATSLVDAFRTHESKNTYELVSRGKSVIQPKDELTEQEKELAQNFHKLMAKVRKAVGTSNDSWRALRDMFEPQERRGNLPVPCFSRRQLLVMLPLMIENPKVVLNEEGWGFLNSHIDADALSSQAPTAPSQRSTPRF